MSKTIRSIIAGTILAVAILIFSIGVLAPYLPQEIARPAWRGTFSFQSEAAIPLRVAIDRGTVYIQTSDRSTIAIEANLRLYVAASATYASVETFGRNAVRAELVEDAFEVSTPMSPPGLSVRCDLEIAVPRGTDIRVENRDGTLRVGPGCGVVSADLINGDMLVYAPEGAVDLHTVNGRILLLDSASGGKASTVDGSIYARLRGGELDADVANGFIGVTLLDPAVKRCDLSSVNGHISVGLTPACRTQVDVQTERGTVSCDLKAEPVLLPGSYTRAWRGTAVGHAAAWDSGPLCLIHLRARNGNLAIREDG